MTDDRSPWNGKHGPLLIAEIGGNHEGDFEYAIRLTDLAIDSGTDFVKFQLYRGDTLVSPFESPDRNRHFARFELTQDQHLELARRCEAAGVGYIASVWDVEMLDWIDDHLKIYKIGSGDLTAYPMIRELARRGKPIILSTGLSTLQEILESVRFIQSVNAAYRSPEMLALLQCTSMYPISFDDANLAVMDTLREATGLAVGYSDHTEGSLALSAAAARGAQILEFHFTDQREGKSFRDHKVSLTRDEVRQLCNQLDDISRLLGDGVKRPLTSEVESDHVTTFRRGVYSRRALKAGDALREEDMVILRPNHGVDARRFDEVIGKRVARDLGAYEALELQDDVAGHPDGKS
jgi:N-acetylneuraminate synthase/N,N'-diacetyllegionaminate synthase